MSAKIGAIKFDKGHKFTPPQPGFSLAWLEGPLNVCFAFLKDVPGWNNLECWPSGRLFGAEGEYRWEKNNEGIFSATLLLDNLEMPDWMQDILDLENVEDSAFILWGDWVDPDQDSEGNSDKGPRFYAGELPKIQTYPLLWNSPPKKDETPQLLVRRYRDIRSGNVDFIRCLDVKMQKTDWRESYAK
jgi:hypothetical protein